MSVKLTIKLELPLEDVANIQAGVTTAGAKRSAQVASQATLDAIRALPYQIHSTAAVKANSPRANHPVNLYVKSLTGKTTTLNTPLSTTVGDLKLLVQSEEGFSPDMQRLIFAGKEVGGVPEEGDESDQELRTLDSYGIQRDSIINLVLRLRNS